MPVTETQAIAVLKQRDEMRDRCCDTAALYAGLGRDAEARFFRDIARALDGVGSVREAERIANAIREP